MSIALVFPPVVSSGFGSYYPSLAVLAGTLADAGHRVMQLDLNESLAEHLLAPDVLNASGNGIFFDAGPSETTSMSAVAARLLSKNRAQLFDAEGRHRFSERNQTPAYLLSVMAHPYLVDIPVSDALTRLRAADPLVHWYRAFYRSVDLGQLFERDLSLVGISVAMGPQLFPALILCDYLKSIRSDVRIVLGGPTMSLMAEWEIEMILKALSGIDAVVRYDGEQPLFALAAQAQAEAWQPRCVPGASSVCDGDVTHVKPAPGPALNRLPFASYDPVLVSKLSDPELGVVQTRGCYWGRCAYCDFVELYDGSPKFRGRSPASFVQEVSHLRTRHGAKRFSLITEAIPPSFALKFSELAIAQRLDITWGSFAMVDHHFERRHFDAMARSGCDHLVIGLETMTDRVLKLVHKYATGSDNAHFLKTAHAAGISLYVNLIPDLPTTTYDEAMDSLSQLEDLEHVLTSVAVFPFEATRSSQIGRDPARYGIKVANPAGESGQASFASNHLRIVDDGMSLDQRTDVIARYTRFADRINTRRRGMAYPQDDQHKHAPRTERIRVAVEDNDIVRTGDGIRVFNWRTQNRWDGPAGLKPLIERAAAMGQSFTRDELAAGAKRADGVALLVDELVRRDVFVVAP